MQFPGSMTTANSRSSFLPALLGVLIAIVFWMLGDDAREKVREVESQVSSAGMTSRRLADVDPLEDSQETLQHARKEKDKLVARLQTDESAQMVRARMIFDLRQKCAATGATACSVRLADDSITGSTLASAGTGSAAVPPAASRDGKLRLADLGILKARAIVSGQFQTNEVVEFAKRLNEDPDAYWRINGLVVRDRSFEFDVERHLIEKPAHGS